LFSIPAKSNSVVESFFDLEINNELYEPKGSVNIQPITLNGFKDGTENGTGSPTNNLKSCANNLKVNNNHEDYEFKFHDRDSSKLPEVDVNTKTVPDISYKKPAKLDNGSPSNECNFSSINMEESEYLLVDYIKKVIDNGFISKIIRVGRPRQHLDNSPDAMQRFYQTYTRKLQENIEAGFTQKRSDTFRNTIFCYLKKLPMKIRDRSCSTSEPKSRKFKIFLNAFLMPFITCFLPYFDFGPEYNKVELFLYFMCI